jgi:hypothetical protein
MIAQFRWHDLPAMTLAPLRRPIILAALAFGGMVLWLAARVGDEPAPLALHAGAIYTFVALIAALAPHGASASPQASGGRQVLVSLLRTALLLVTVHWLARALGMPALPHPASTTLALLAAALFGAGLSGLWTQLAAGRAHGWTNVIIPLIIVLGIQVGDVGRGVVSPFLALSPGHWAQAAIQTAVTGTGTRAAAGALLALAGVGALAMLAAFLPARRWPPGLLAAGWLGLSALVWQRPPPPLPRADMGTIYSVGALADLSTRDSRIAPIARTAPDAALASALGRVQRQIAKWPPALADDPEQRARNLLLIAAVPDLYDTEPLQSHLPLLVQAELRARVPAAILPGMLADIAAHPEQGSVAARKMLPALGLPASTGDEAAVRKRVALYAAKLREEMP